MECKKCGANVADTAKFCGYCGNPVEQSSVSNETIVQSNFNNNIENYSMPVENMENNAIQNTTVVNNNQNEAKKNQKVLYIILGIILAIIAVVLVVFAFNKSSNNSVAILQKAIANLNKKGENNGSLVATISLVSESTGSINVSAVSKYEKIGDIYNFEVTLNKNLFFEETSMYLTCDKEKLKLYVQSNLVDLMGSTSSDTNKWLNYTLNLAGNDLNLEESTLKNYNINLSNIIDSDHFVYIDSKENLNHYQLVIDEKLIKNIKKELSKLDDENIDEALESISEEEISFEETYKVDFYINNSNELVAISIDLADAFDSDEITSAIIKLEFKDLGNTIVTMPKEAINSSTDLMEYFENNSIIDDDYELDFDYSLDYE